MKAQITSAPARLVNPYPMLKKHRISKLVVLFNAPYTGMVVNPLSFHPIGETLDCWNEEAFDLFDGKVVLSNN